MSTLKPPRPPTAEEQSEALYDVFEDGERWNRREVAEVTGRTTSGLFLRPLEAVIRPRPAWYWDQEETDDKVHERVTLEDDLERRAEEAVDEMEYVFPE